MERELKGKKIGKKEKCKKIRQDNKEEKHDGNQDEAEKRNEE